MSMPQRINVVGEEGHGSTPQDIWVVEVGEEEPNAPAFGSCATGTFTVAASPQTSELAHLAELVTKATKLIEKSTKTNTTPFNVQISSLGSGDYSLRCPISLLIVPEEDEFIASLLDAQITTSGDTIEEAVSNLQSLIEDFADSLLDMSDDKLGLIPRRQKAALKELLCRTSIETMQSK